jgi:methyltransferase (TIGR00027 family)
MFTSLRRVTYPVADLAQAREWYCRVLETKPVFDSPFAVAFAIGHAALVLIPVPEASERQEVPPVAFWTVDDIDAAYHRLLELGARSESEIATSMDIQRAKVIDPFGNVIGIMAEGTRAEQRTVEKQPSETAYNVALARAVAARDAHEALRGPDYLAEIFLSEESRRAIRDAASRDYIKQLMTPELFGFLSARTNWLDRIFGQCLTENWPQIVFLGAGYDSRSYRFRDQIRSTRLFELDVQTTQERKQKALEQAGVFVPGQLVFVPINFQSQSIADALTAAGFQRGEMTLFIWEGVSYYLTAQAVDESLRNLREIAPAGSLLCFDYMNSPRPSRYAGEPFQFFIPRESIPEFLDQRGFALTAHYVRDDITTRFLPHGDGLPEARSLSELGFVECRIA